jgi:hypothetical protein
VPVGIFHRVEGMTYEDRLQAQIDGAIAKRGKGEIAKLFHEGDTWIASGGAAGK